jgi:hypothetical protein
LLNILILIIINKLRREEREPFDSLNKSARRERLLKRMLPQFLQYILTIVNI